MAMRIIKMICIVVLLGFTSCQNDASKSSGPKVPDHPVTEDEAYITEAYIDSLEKNRKQRIIDLRRELSFNCVDLVDNSYVNMKIKVYPDGKYDNIEVLEKEDVEMDSIRACINDYFSKNTKLNLGELKDLPSSGKTTNKHPHVYTLLIY
jgi:hypothetical protein